MINLKTKKTYVTILIVSIFILTTGIVLTAVLITQQLGKREENNKVAENTQQVQPLQEVTPPLITEPAIPIPTGENIKPLELSPLKASELTKTDSTLQNVDCFTEGLRVYSTGVNGQSEEIFPEMKIISKEDAVASSSDLEVNEFERLINREVDEASYNFFLSSCSGIYSFHLYDVRDIQFENTDAHRIAVYHEGNGIGGYAFIRVFAKKGDNYIMISAPVIGSTLKDQVDFYNPLIEQCINGDDFSGFAECYESSLINQADISREARKKAEQIIETFAI